MGHPAFESTRTLFLYLAFMKDGTPSIWEYASLIVSFGFCGIRSTRRLKVGALLEVGFSAVGGCCDGLPGDGGLYGFAKDEKRGVLEYARLILLLVVHTITLTVTSLQTICSSQ